MKSIEKIVGFILLMVFPFIANAQSLYEESGKLVWKKQVQRGSITYNIQGTPFRCHGTPLSCMVRRA